MAGQHPGRIVQNEPNSGYVPWHEHLACACEAWAGCPCHSSDSPGPIVRQHLVARCRSGSKPNLARLGQGRVPGGRKMRNEPNSYHYADPEIGVPGRAKRAKRTQLPEAGHRGGVGRRGRGEPHYSTIPSFHPSNPLPIVQNKPNFRRDRLGRGLWDAGCCTDKPDSSTMPIRRSAFPGWGPHGTRGRF